MKAKRLELIAVHIEVYGRGSSDFVHLLTFVTKTPTEVRIELPRFSRLHTKTLPFTALLDTITLEDSLL